MHAPASPFPQRPPVDESATRLLTQRALAFLERVG